MSISIFIIIYIVYSREKKRKLHSEKIGLKKNCFKQIFTKF